MFFCRRRTREQRILACDCLGPDCPLNGIGVDIEAAIVQEALECLAAAPGIADRLRWALTLELRKSTLLITSLSPGVGAKLSRHTVAGGDIAGLLARFGELRANAQARSGNRYPLAVIHEAGLDGFWIDRRLRQEDEFVRMYGFKRFS